MKSLFRYIAILILLMSSISVLAKTRIDSIDNWHVLYNSKVIGQYSLTDHNPLIIIKKNTIQSKDTLTVFYVHDMRYYDNVINLYVLNKKRERVIIAKGIGSWNPLKVSVKEILNKARSFHQNYLDFYFYDFKHNQPIFRLKLK